LCDNLGRRLDYLRLAVTDLCNLRCRYCMPAAGIALDDRADILTWEELLRLCSIACDLGVRKIRITGGEPLVRIGVADFMSELGRLPQRPELLLTTNGTRLAGHLADLARAGVRRLNVSLDSLLPDRYRTIVRRDRLTDVLAALAAADAAGFGLKINVVVLPGLNDAEIPDFVELTRARRWTVRFIEPMPFCGGSQHAAGRQDSGRQTDAIGSMTADQIVRVIMTHYRLEPVVNDPSAVDRLYRVRGFAGRVGVIASHTRAFCGCCSRLRISAGGQLRTCLYGKPALDLRALLRNGATDNDIAAAITRAACHRHTDGFAAEQARARDRLGSMARIGG
jgi:cyclic pyranopterin phosphate synthase